MPKIIHFHYNAADNVNIGDEAHVLAIQEALRARIPELEIKEIPISFLSHFQLPPSFPGAKHLPLSIHNAARILRGTSYSSLIHEVNQADMIVIGGGGVYMDHLLPFNTALLQRFVTPVVIFGAGYNQNTGAADFTPQQLHSIVSLGNSAKLHSVRDMNTYTFLKQNDIQTTLIGDPAVFLQKADISFPKKQENILNIGINIAAHGWKQQETYIEHVITAYTQALLQIQKQYSIDFYYFIHHPNEHTVVRQLNEKGVTFKAVVDKNARETKAMYSVMDATISMMLHSTILAYGEGVPAICIGYDKKNASFMELTGQPSRHIPVATINPEVLFAQAQGLLKDLTNAKHQIAKNLRELQPIYSRFADEVAALVN